MIACFGLVGLLVLLGVLQYRGLRQISEAERESARKRVQEQTSRFAEDFNREIQSVFFNFQTDAESWKRGDPAAFNERLDYWKERAAYPDLIGDFYFIPASGNEILQYDREKRTFVPAAGSDYLTDLKSRLQDPEKAAAVQADLTTVAMPVHEQDGSKPRMMMQLKSDLNIPEVRVRQRAGTLAAHLNEGVIRTRLIPDLTAKYFGDGEYKVTVLSSSAQQPGNSNRPSEPDAAARLFDLSPANVIQFANKDAIREISGERRVESVVLNSHVSTPPEGSVLRRSGGPETFQIEMKRGGEPKTTIFAASGDAMGPGWTLEIRHNAGSIDTYIASTFRRNVAIGFGMLFLLAGAIGTIIYSAQRAKKLAQRQVDFVSSVSHEFRTPLAVICTAGENLSDGVTKETGHVAQYGALIKGEGRKLTSMVEQILEFAGANSGRKKYNFEDTTAAEVVEKALAECEMTLHEKGFQLQSEVAPELAIHADSAALSGAIQNLILNAVKYSNGDKWMRIAAANGGSTVRISVEDHGIGISKKDLKQVFDPFFRSSEAVDAQIHGSGLGLSLVKQIAAAHGGRVHAQSEPGKGSTFTIEIPVRPVRQP